jgi:mannose-1-phosphate guanylyltransferase
MKLVLLSGGSGKRLWPLSNDSRSKQFLKVLQNKNGERVSMVQRVWSQLQEVGLAKSTVIATSNTQVEMIQSQLEQFIPIIIEPERRDTFPAIALAASYLYSVEKAHLDEVVVVAPVDPHVENDFFEKLVELEELVNKTNADIALIGVNPTYPSEKYGYIVPDSCPNNNEYVNVSHFREKPTESQAIELLKENALWNCGVFGFKLDYIISLIKSMDLPVEYTQLLEHYNKLPKISFDYEVVEKANKIVALPYSGYWKDLGTWNTLTEEMSSISIGNGIVSKDSKNTHLINELDIPVTVMGLSNVIVAASPDGILVSDKEQSPKIKDMISQFDNRPMYEERRWGWYKVLDYTKYDEKEVLTKRICVMENKYISYQIDYKDKIWTVINGLGEFIINGTVKAVHPGDVLHIPAEAKYALRAINKVELIEVKTGHDLINEDTMKISSDWNEIMDYIKVSTSI